MTELVYSFGEDPAAWRQAGAVPIKGKASKKAAHGAHGMTGMAKIIAMACETSDPFDPRVSQNGTPQSTFGRLSHASSGLPMPLEDYKAAIRHIATEMLEDEPTTAESEAAAGQAFLGQFIDHDLTLDAMTQLSEVFAPDVSLLRNFRTPRLDLDCVYGGGPEVSPHLFDQQNEGKMLFGRPGGEGDPEGNPLDLPRNRQGRALIGDPRNDENLFVSQVHARRFVQKHNDYVDSEGDYEKAREKLTEEYHREIVEKFLPDVVQAHVLQPFLDWLRGNAPAPTTGHVTWNLIPDMPVEFSAAAYRFGHSMIRQNYELKSGVTEDIFNARLKGFSPVHEDDNIDMDLFFGDTAQPARPIDTKIPRALIELPDEVVGADATTDERNLAFRNMDRGQITFRLPSGEALAHHMGFAPVDTHADVAAVDLEGHTPLWFYILHEAGQGGGKLGPVGGSLVAGVLVNLLKKGNSPIARPFAAS